MDVGVSSHLCLQAALRPGLSGADAGPFEMKVYVHTLGFMHVTAKWA